MFISPKTLIIVICAALCCAIVYSYFYKKIFCGFVGKLIEKNAIGKENELLLSSLELSAFSVFFIKKALSVPTSALARVTSSMDDGKGHVLVYLLPEKEEEAKKRFKDTKTSVVTVVVSIILCIVVTIFAIFIYPTIESIIYNARNDFETEENDKNYSENIPSVPETDNEDSPVESDIPEENPEDLQNDSDESATDGKTEDDTKDIPKIPETESRFE